MQKKSSNVGSSNGGSPATSTLHPPPVMANPLKSVTYCTLPDESNSTNMTIPVIHSLSTDRIAVFIDGSNLFYAALQLGIEIDYAKLLQKLVGHRRLLRAYFYTGVDPTNEKQQGFLLWMRRNGYRVITKDLHQLPDGTKKANLDVEIAIDMINLASHCETIVLLSGDGDLAYALNSIAYKGVQVEVVSLRSMTSDQLINFADRYTDLQGIQREISKISGQFHHE
jgi:uncharacterized LabA/DUF88 family protein